MKKIKTFYLTKSFIENELGIKNVVVAHSPVTVVNNVAMVAKNFKWKSLEEVKNDDMFKDLKALEGVCYLYEMDVKEHQSYYDKMLNQCEITEDATYVNYVESFLDAESFQARLFVS